MGQETYTKFNEMDRPSDPSKAPIEGEVQISSDQPPAIIPKPGYTTTQGQFTGIYGLVVVGLAIFGIVKTPDQIDNYFQLVNNMAIIIVPILSYIPVLIGYINSRGKIQSNTVWANAEVIKAATSPGTQLPNIEEQAANFGWFDKVKQGMAVGQAVKPVLPGNIQVVMDKANQVIGVVDLINGLFHHVYDTSRLGQEPKKFVDNTEAEERPIDITKKPE